MRRGLADLDGTGEVVGGVIIVRQGAEPEMGRRLAALFQDAGLLNVRSGVLGGQWGAPLAADLIQSEWNVLSSDLDGLVSPAELADLIRRARSLGVPPDGNVANELRQHGASSASVVALELLTEPGRD